MILIYLIFFIYIPDLEVGMRNITAHAIEGLTFTFK